MMKGLNSRGTLFWIVLLIATAIPPVTTPVDKWTGWTVYSLVGAIVCIVGLIVAFVRSHGPTKES